MVQPPNHPAASHLNNDIQLRAATTDTSQYLAARVGELVEAKVIKVTQQLVSDKAGLERQLTAKPESKASTKQPMNVNAPSKTISAKAAIELNPNRYQVLMDVGANKTLSVQSPLAPRIGQILQLQVLSHQQVEIMGLRTGVISESTPLISSASQQALAAKNAGLISNSQTDHAKALATLQASLRTNLPRQTTKESLTATLETLTRQQSLLPASLQTAITQLQKSISPLQQLTQANGLANALNNSGLLYEAKLAQLLTAARTKGIGISNPAIKTLANALNLNNGLVPSDTQTQAQTQTQVKASNIDHKQAVLQLINTLKSSLHTSNVASGKPINPALQNNATLASLWTLVTNATMADASLKTSSGESNEQLLQLLRLALSVVTRTQSQQLFTANTQLLATNDNVANQSWSLELPLWVDQKLNVIDIHIEAEKDSEQLTAADEKAWNARLSFDLEEHGSMVAFATLRGKTIAAVLWVTKAATVNKVNRELALMSENLDRLGLKVERLQCRVGEPDDVRPNGTINLLDNLLDTEV